MSFSISRKYSSFALYGVKHREEPKTRISARISASLYTFVPSESNIFEIAIG